jgi:hypothetical protein
MYIHDTIVRDTILFATVLLLFIFTSLAVANYFIVKERSHECSWYVERNYTADGVPFRCFSK